MRPELPDEAVKGFYDGIELPLEQENAIRSMRTVVAESRRWKRVAIATTIAAVLSATLAANLFFKWKRTEVQLHAALDKPSVTKRIVVKDSPPPAAVIPSLPGTIPVVESDEPELRLVLIASHGHRCPRCSASKSLFANLRQQITDERLGFIEVHLNDQASREENRELLTTLGLQHLLERRQETGYLLVTSANGDVLQKFNPMDDGQAKIRQIIESSL